MRFLFFIVIIIAAIACADNRQVKPKNLLNKTPMTAVLADVFIADAVANEKKIRDSSLNANALTAAYYQQIFKLHNTSREQFMMSYDYYVDHPDNFKEILDSATIILNKRMASERKPTETTPTSPSKTPPKTLNPNRPFLKSHKKNQK
jgi:hypothetical protein